MLGRFTYDVSIDGGSQELIQVIPFGMHETGRGSFVLDREGMREILSEFNSHASDMVVDYEHQSLGPGEAPAAGWIKRLVDRDADGLWAEVEWTPRAAEFIRSGEYRYLSPVFLKTAREGRAVRLINAALTNRPAIDGMVPVTGGHEAVHATQEGGTMMKQIFDALGIEVGTEADAASAIEALRNRLDAVTKAIGAKPDADDAELTGTLAAMRQSHEAIGALAERVAELEAALRGRDARELVAAAMSEGKLSPAQLGWANEYADSDPEGFRVFVAKAPVIVPVFDAPKGAAQQRPRIDETQQAVNALMGIQAETFTRHN